jgi:hypothetical protein
MLNEGGQQRDPNGHDVAIWRTPDRSDQLMYRASF